MFPGGRARGRAPHSTSLTGRVRFATALTRPVPRLVEGGSILVTTLATFDREGEARAFLRALQGICVQQRERIPQELQALERHGLMPAHPPPGPAVC